MLKLAACRVFGSKVFGVRPSSLLLLALAALAGFSPGVTLSAADLAGSGNRLNMMHKIQGTWRGVCEPVANGPKYGYQYQTLNISYTHFKLTTTVYSDDRCVKELQRHNHSFRYNLGESLLTTGDKAVFALNLSGEQGGDDAQLLYPYNIVRFDDGQLLFGLAPAIDHGERLKVLDYQHPFVR